MSVRARWWTRREPDVPIHTRVLALPHAGSGAAVYAGWTAALLRHGIDFVPIQLPGREDRCGEAPFTSMAALVDAVGRAVRPLLDRPFAIFGHSMGALAGFELARRLTHDGTPPVRLFASGAEAPQVPRTQPPLHRLEDLAFLAGVDGRYGGLPRQVFESSELRTLVLRPLRADLTIVETYVFDGSDPLRCPIDVLHGRDDTVTSPTRLSEWAAVTTGPVWIRAFNGGHFFVRSESDDLRTHIVCKLRQM